MSLNKYTLSLALIISFCLGANQALARQALSRDEGMYCISLHVSLNRANREVDRANDSFDNNYCGGTTSDPHKFGRCRYYEGRGKASEYIAKQVADEYNRHCAKVSMSRADVLNICTTTKFGSRVFKNNAFCKGFDTNLGSFGANASAGSFHTSTSTVEPLKSSVPRTKLLEFFEDDE